MSWKDEAKALIKGDPVDGAAGMFGLDVPYDDAALVLLMVAWDGTASYGKGTACGPNAIRSASHQLDYFDLDFGAPLLGGIATETTKIPYRPSVLPAEVNLSSADINRHVYERAKAHIAANRIVGVVGGEHSVPYGLFKALSEKHKSFGVLHIDAHHDLRQAYEGYEHSHASIMYNVLEAFSEVKNLVSVGIRDFSHEEFSYARGSKRVETYYDQHLQKRKAEGQSWLEIVREMVSKLPDAVYVSFDIDGLDPALCPHTGTPVPGGLSYAEVMMLIGELAAQKKTIIGFDLCEVGAHPTDEWDANVGARILYRLCGLTLASHGKRFEA